jgi:hypothetical protein
MSKWISIVSIFVAIVVAGTLSLTIDREDFVVFPCDSILAISFSSSISPSNATILSSFPASKLINGDLVGIQPKPHGSIPDYSIVRAKYDSLLGSKLTNSIFGPPLISKLPTYFHMATFLISDNGGTTRSITDSNTSIVLTNLILDVRTRAFERLNLRIDQYCPFVTEYDIEIYGSILGDLTRLYNGTTTIADIQNLDYRVFQIQLFGQGDKISESICANLLALQLVKDSCKYLFTSIEQCKKDFANASTFDAKMEIVFSHYHADIINSERFVFMVPASVALFLKYVLKQGAVALGGNGYVAIFPYGIGMMHPNYMTLAHEAAHDINQLLRTDYMGSDTSCGINKYHSKEWYHLNVWIGDRIRSRGNNNIQVGSDGYNCTF